MTISERLAAFVLRVKALEAENDRLRASLNPAAELVGTPFASRWAASYPRNVWDMTVYDGKIYLGNGNSANLLPSPNAGDAQIAYYDPATDTFTKVTDIAEEQIERYVVLADGRLIIPGHDPQRGNGKLYDGETGAVLHDLGFAIHVYDVILHGGLLYAAVDNAPNKVAVYNGSTWDTLPQDAVAGTIPVRNYALFEIGSRLFCSADLYVKSTASYTNVWFEVLSDHLEVPAGADFTPGTSLIAPRMYRYATLGTDVICIVGLSRQDMQCRPYEAYVIDADLQGVKLTLPEGATAWDVHVEGSTAYILLNTVIDDAHYTVAVISSTDLANWTEVCSFEAPAFARSFTLLSGVFYFGLGSGTGTAVNETQPPGGGDGLALCDASGQIWRLTL